MLPIGGRPILWHIMKIYASHGCNDFVLALGWRGDEIRRFFLQYHALTCDFTVQLGRPDEIEFLNGHPEEAWRVTCVATGLAALTGATASRRSTSPRGWHSIGAMVGWPL